MIVLKEYLLVPSFCPTPDMYFFCSQCSSPLQSHTIEPLLVVLPYDSFFLLLIVEELCPQVPLAKDCVLPLRRLFNGLLAELPERSYWLLSRVLHLLLRSVGVLVCAVRAEKELQADCWRYLDSYTSWVVGNAASLSVTQVDWLFVQVATISTPCTGLCILAPSSDVPEEQSYIRLGDVHIW